MKKRHILLITLATLCAMTSCKDKTTQTDNIIVPEKKAEEVKEEGPKQMTQTRQQREIKWLDNTYNIQITRMVDKNLPLTEDESGEQYYDNYIEVSITRKDGSTFFEHRYTKSDFMPYVSNNDYAKTGALLGIVFDQIKDNRLSFATSIGSPDMGSDAFIPLIMTIDRNGNVSIVLDTQMDTSNGNASQGPTGDEEA